MSKLKKEEAEIYSIINELNSVNQSLLKKLIANRWDQEVSLLLQKREELSSRLDQFSDQVTDLFQEKTKESIQELLKLNQEMAVHLERKIENFKGLIARKSLLGL